MKQEDDTLPYEAVEEQIAEVIIQSYKEDELFVCCRCEKKKPFAEFEASGICIPCDDFVTALRSV